MYDQNEQMHDILTFYITRMAWKKNIWTKFLTPLNCNCRIIISIYSYSFSNYWRSCFNAIITCILCIVFVRTSSCFNNAWIM